MRNRGIVGQILLDADASREVLAEIVREADYASPMANCYRNPIPTEVVLA